MPLYLYACPDCEAEAEVSHSMDIDPLTLCDNCGYKMSRKPQRTSNTFQGPGFYINDKKTK